MTFSPLANLGVRIPDGGRSVPRQSAITGFGIHHNAGVNAYSEAWNPNREVSANYWIANDGTIIPNIDEERRAFTSGAAGYPAGALADHRNITVEVSNSPEGVRSGSWAISDAAMNSLIALIADVYLRYGLGPVVRGSNRGLGVHQDWVPTSCPGPYIMNNLSGIIDAANRIIIEGEDDMYTDADRARDNKVASQVNSVFRAIFEFDTGDFKVRPNGIGREILNMRERDQKLVSQVNSIFRSIFEIDIDDFVVRPNGIGREMLKLRDTQFGGVEAKSAGTLALLEAICEKLGIEIPADDESGEAKVCEVEEK